MKLGIGTYTFTWAVGVAGFMPKQPLSMEQLLDKAHQLGVKRVQFCDNLPLQTANFKTEVEIEVGTRGLTVINLLNNLEVCRRFNSPFLRVVIDDVGYHPSEQEVIEVIQMVIEDFKQANVILAIENHDRFTVASLVRIIQQTDPQWVGICLDTANSLGAGEGIEEVVKGLAPYTVNLHVKDFTIKRAWHNMGFVVEGCPAGKGMLNVPWVLEQLRPYQRCISATLEIWSNPETTIEATIEKEAAWAIESISYLKTVL